MSDITEAQKKQEFNENFEIMKESEEGAEAYKETFEDQTKAENFWLQVAERIWAQ